MDSKPQVEMREVSFIAPVPLINWLNEQAEINGIDGDQFLNALLYAVWNNYLLNKQHEKNGKTLFEEQTQPQTQIKASQTDPS